MRVRADTNRCLSFSISTSLSLSLPLSLSLSLYLSFRSCVSSSLYAISRVFLSQMAYQVYLIRVYLTLVSFLYFLS